MLDDLFKIGTGQALTTTIPKVKISRRKILIAALSSVMAVGLIGAGLFITRPSSNSASSPQIPNVVGLTQADAQAMLKDYVVTIQHAHDAVIPLNRVASQIPLATTKAQKGSGVVLTISDGPGDAAIPENLVGMSLNDARAALAAVGLVIAQTQAVASDQALGTVLKVIPDPGSTITAGTGVVLQIASGQVDVPSLIGIDAIQAKTILVQAGFLVKEIDAYDATAPIGTVIRQAPDGGTTQTIGKSVTITVNKAP
jgi:serine/threonine-protein kinase